MEHRRDTVGGQKMKVQCTVFLLTPLVFFSVQVFHVSGVVLSATTMLGNTSANWKHR